MMHTIGCREEAEDVVQDAFVQAFTNLARFEKKSLFYTWLYRIAHNVRCSRARRKRPKPMGEQATEMAAQQPARGPRRHNRRCNRNAMSDCRKPCKSFPKTIARFSCCGNSNNETTKRLPAFWMFPWGP